MKESAVRNRILEVASRLFYEQGYNLTGINQIIEEAGIARGSLYNHFDSKTTLLLAYLADAEDIWFEDMQRFAASYTDPAEQLLSLFDFRIEKQHKTKFGGCHFIKISAEVSKEDALVFEAVIRQKTRLKLFIGSLVETLKRPDMMLTKDLLMEALFLLLEGAAVTGSVFKTHDSMVEAKKIAIKLIGIPV